MKAVQKKWLEKKALIINGITFSDERIICFEIENERLGRKGITDVTKILEQNPNFWTDTITQNKLEIPEKSCTAICGGGAYGADGFIALVGKNNNLIWIVFFQTTNPFLELEIRNDSLLATSALNYRLFIPLNSPEEMVLTKVRRVFNDYQVG